MPFPSIPPEPSAKNSDNKKPSGGNDESTGSPPVDRATTLRITPNTEEIPHIR
ncbi:uncharacterized protein BDZ83DRAFT_89444 [Colletotrichum acutatum]|uniref:Uncharacterized protein n=1 Tax=Glomerella acutata TaxID=27357 RepID=A0AAD8XKE8_GLOAC|nr:uncharacterized protein BDZ83DRAFT_89444 [Colletotrichum acutatum]KAK1728983.1 hypothetical protein BDZ83DRAFT_89444 [Colletotrichum acutatum]